MNYTDLALQNQYLFNDLEKNSEQLAFLNTRREQIKKQINENMEQLDELLIKQRERDQKLEEELKIQGFINEHNNNEGK